MRSSQSARSWIPALKSLSIRSARIRSSSSGSLGVSSRCSAISSVISGATTGTSAMCPGSSWFGVSSIIGVSSVQLDFGDVRHRDLGGEFAADELDPPQLRVLVLGDGFVQQLPGDGLRMLAGVLGQEGVDVFGRPLTEDHRVHQPDLDHGCDGFSDCFSNLLLSCSNSSSWWEYFSSLFASSSVRQIYPGAQRENLIAGRTGIGSPGS